MAAKRKLWTDESMEAATKSVVDDGMGLRQAARVYNVPVETLRRRVNGTVPLGCHPGPHTVLSEEEELSMVEYIINMADMGFGLTREDVMQLAYTIAEKTGKQHPFQNGLAGRSWFEGFRARHHRLTFRTAQPLSYCRALCSNPDTVNDFFSKLGALYGKHDLLTKPKLVFNVDETGVTIVHKPGKVLAELGRRNVYALTSAERGRTHTILICVSASGFSIPPLMVYPRKQRVPDNMREGAIPGTIFEVSKSGWINQEIYMKWFDFFISNIPPIRPVLLIQDDHASHISIDLIEKARANDIHLLCLPAHTTHILQPLDVGVFKSFKHYFNKACQNYMKAHPGQVITSTVLAPLVAEVVTISVVPLNILSGFKKCGIHPLNPGEVKDRQLAPAKAVRPDQQQLTTSDASQNLSATRWSPEQIALYQVRFEEGFDLEGFDQDYIDWLKSEHPYVGNSVSPAVSSLSSGVTSSSSDVLSDILVYPKPSKKSNTRKRKPALNSLAVCITEDCVLEELKENEQEKAKKDAEKEKRKLENEQKKIATAGKKVTKKEKRMVEHEQKRKVALEEKAREDAKKEKLKLQNEQKKTAKKLTLLQKKLQSCTINDDTSEDETRCPVCGAIYEEDESDSLWICCDNCDLWYCLKCADVLEDNIPDIYYCDRC